MLYQLYETQRALMAPFAEFASATAKLYDHPLSPFAQTPWAQRISAAFDLVHRLAKEYEKPEFGITGAEVDGITVAVQEQVAVAKPFCRLLRFKRFTDDPHALGAMKKQPAVLVVAPLSGHHATLLRDTVKSLLQHHKVYITDWTDARMVPVEVGPFRLSDYVRYVQEFIRHVGPDVHVISVCQPTVPVLAAVSLMATAGEATPLTLTMMGGPIDARRSPTAVNNLAMNKSYGWFESNVIYRVPPNFPGAGRRVYPGFLQHTGFVAMNPDRHLNSHYDYFLDLVRGDDDSADSHRRFYDEYNAVLDLPAEYYLDTIKTVFQDFALVNGTWEIDGQLVRPQDITDSALLTIEGELDDISGAGQTRAAHGLCTGIAKDRQFHYDALGAGHYGIFSGRRWRQQVYPEVREFIRRFDRRNAHGAATPRQQAIAPGLPLAHGPDAAQGDALLGDGLGTAPANGLLDGVVNGLVNGAWAVPASAAANGLDATGAPHAPSAAAPSADARSAEAPAAARRRSRRAAPRRRGAGSGPAPT